MYRGKTQEQAKCQIVSHQPNLQKDHRSIENKILHNRRNKPFFGYLLINVGISTTNCKPL